MYRGGYSTIELDGKLRGVTDERDRAYITRLFYGVLEKDAALAYAIEKLCDKAPKTSVAVLLKMGMYMIVYMQTPCYAAVDKIVELAKRLGKGGVSGFINAVLRKYEAFVPPGRGEVADALYLSVRSGAPVWLCDKLIGAYGFDFASGILNAEQPQGTHIRRNAHKIERDAFEEKLKESGDFAPDRFEIGYYVKHSTMKNLPNDLFTPQSLSSMLAVRYYAAAYGKGSGRVLDVCAAPGGKSVYLSELGEFDITACDVHPHRVGLIESYAARMGAAVKAVRNDGRVVKPEWRKAFDLVICDVPCSGIGVLSSKPDIALRRTPESVRSLVDLQNKLLAVSSEYVADDGCLCYSTCTVMPEENEGVVASFLKNGAFEPVTVGVPNDRVLADALGDRRCREDDFLRLYPQDRLDGFFAATFRRKRI